VACCFKRCRPHWDAVYVYAVCIGGGGGGGSCRGMPWANTAGPARSATGLKYNLKARSQWLVLCPLPQDNPAPLAWP
jgi:hypothetical protein